MLRVLLPAAFLGLAACATQPAPEPPAAATAARPQGAAAAEKEAVLAVVDRFMLAVGNHDSEEMQDILINEGVAWFQQRENGQEGTVRPFVNGDMMQPDSDADPFLERYWDPIVLVRGHIATVWAPYELRDNGEVIHCGIDALNLVYLDDAWRVATILSTMEPGACEELKPPSASEMRPQNGWKETPLE